MAEQLPSFEITVGGREVSLQVGRCAVALFRRQQEVSYIAVDQEDETTLRIFNNLEFAQWLSYKIVEENGAISRLPVVAEFNGEDKTFREVTGWSPAVVEREEPSEHEIEMWADVNARDMEKGLDELLGGSE